MKLTRLLLALLALALCVGCGPGSSSSSDDDDAASDDDDSAGDDDDSALNSFPTIMLTQASPAQVDLLLVVDNLCIVEEDTPCMMEDKQAALGQGFAALVQYFEQVGVDYHIGVTTTDMSDPEHQGRLVDAGGHKVIDIATANAAQVFAENVQVGIGGSSFERGLDAAAAALSEPLSSGENSDFLREDGLLSILFVSDSEDRSHGGTRSHLAALQAIQGDFGRQAVNTSGLIPAVDGVAADCQTPSGELVAAAAYRYEDLASRTGGVVQSICEEDLAPALTEIGRRNARQRRSFTLGGVAVTAKAVLYMSPEGASEPTELDPAGSYPWTLVDEGSDTSSPSWFLNFTDTLPPAGSRLGLRYEGPLSGTAPPAGACRDHVDCLAVAGRTACLGGTCESVECWESMDCPLGSVCAGNWACQAGCQNDGDCPAEETCEDGTCVKASCRSTLLDCDFGEFCNAVSGECYQSGGYYCSECETKFDCNGGVDGPNWCLNMSGSEPYYCGVDCWAGQECPAGYSCSRIRTAGNVTVGYVCTAPCWEL